MTTRSGSNDIHGQAFYNFRGRDAGTASFPGGQVGYYQRNNFGGRVGGPIIKDKLFFFLDGERMKQDGLLPSGDPGSFQPLSGGFLSPFRDSEVTGKLDWQATKNIHVFYRFTYNWNRSDANFGYNYQVYENRDNTPSDAAGVDISQGSWSHSFRFGYLKFHNLIGDATQGASFFNPLPTSEILVARPWDPAVGPEPSGAAADLPEQQADQVRRQQSVRLRTCSASVSATTISTAAGSPASSELHRWTSPYRSGCGDTGQRSHLPVLAGNHRQRSGILHRKAEFQLPGWRTTRQPLPVLSGRFVEDETELHLDLRLALQPRYRALGQRPWLRFRAPQ